MLLEMFTFAFYFIIMTEQVKHIRIEDFDYHLPDERIAKFPLTQRDHSKLLYYKNGNISHTHFFDIPSLLPNKSLLVYNNTKVIHARLFFKKKTGALIEIFCLEPIYPSDYQLVFQTTNTCVWKCMVGNLKKWKGEELLLNATVKGMPIVLTATREEEHSQHIYVRFSWNCELVSFSDVLEAVGKLPIPPYLHRESVKEDEITYQTVYSKTEGSVAAPTAGLHFTDEVLNNLHANGISTTEVTLHVGAGTFLPVKSNEIGQHEMHAELVVIEKETITHIIKHIGNIIAVGTTSVRSLESLYYIGVQLFHQQYHLCVNQWEPYTSNDEISVEQSLQTIVDYLTNKQLSSIQFSTQIIIAPGYKRKIVNGLITNFHQPKSTLLLLIAAFVAKDWEKIYHYAMQNDFRFLSYGDSSLLLPE